MKISRIIGSVLFGLACISLFAFCTAKTKKASAKGVSDSTAAEEVTERLPVDTAKYNLLMRKLANGDTTGKWPVKKQPIPLAGAILPFKRVVCFYGNLYSKKMGALGEYAPKQMLSMLDKEVARWQKADPSTPVQPALHYIAVVAAGDPGKDGKYRNRMPFKQIDSVLTIAKMRKNIIVFLDIQVALSTIQVELPLLEKYLIMPLK